ncbi:MAG: transposase family protein [Desulfobacterales bacterium]
MGKYEEIKDRSDEHFKRLAGVRKTTFRKMAEAAATHENERKKISGRPLKLSYGDQVLMTLEYNREYRTYFHLGADCGMSGSNCHKLIKKTEDILVISDDFRLPDRKKMAKNDTEIEAVPADATESPIQRFEKDEILLFRAKKRHTLKTQPSCECRNT